MARARSPAYPAIGLKEAVDAVEKVYKADYQNQIPREIAAKHMGYGGLNGKSLGALSALLKYGLLEGRGDATRVSDRAVQIIAHEPGSFPRTDALTAAMTAPELFVELDLRFDGGKASDQAIRAYLLTRKFIPSAADNAIRSYRDTKSLLTAESEAFRKLSAERGTVDLSAALSDQTRQLLEEKPTLVEYPKAKGPMLQDIFNLDEGPVTLSFPSDLSQESYEDLKDQLELFLRRAKRRALWSNPEYQERRKAEVAHRSARDDEEAAN